MEVDVDVIRNSAGRWRHPARPHRIRADVDFQAVPVLLAPGETADNMLTSRAFGGLAKLLEALGAHDTRIVEQLAEELAPSRYKPVQNDTKAKQGAGDGPGGPSASAKALLKFSTQRDPAALAAFINLRVLNPEHEHWRRGIEAAVLYAREVGDLKVSFTYRVPKGPEAVDAGWPASLATFPLRQWITDARRFYARGDMDEDRVQRLEKPGMVWSHFDVAWEEGLAAARGPASSTRCSRSAPNRDTREGGHGLRRVNPEISDGAGGARVSLSRAAKTAGR